MFLHIINVIWLGVNVEKRNSIVFVLNPLAHHTIGKCVGRDVCDSRDVALWGNMSVDQIYKALTVFMAPLQILLLYRFSFLRKIN